MTDKKRADVVLTERGLCESREKAQAAIMAGLVYRGEKRIEKASEMVLPEDELTVRGKAQPYASRGGLKLEKALQVFPISLEGCITMDIGASHGGFTDCMLQNGAARVYAIDVGRGQLDWKLRNDERVVNLERTNVRYITNEQVPDPIDFFSVDVSFISLCLVLPAARPLLRDDGTAVCLIKPQFEAGREKVGKNGVVREKEIHIEVIKKIYDFCLENGFSVLGLDFSPIKGPEGNIEYLIYIKKSSEPVCEGKIDIPGVVNLSHAQLDNTSHK